MKVNKYSKNNYSNLLMGTQDKKMQIVTSKLKT